MMHAPVSRTECGAALDELLVGALRCWRRARDRRAAVQHCLYQMLDPQDQGMLAPVFDSLMTLFEAALDRPIRAGDPESRSDDERLLLGLLNGKHIRRACINCPEGAGSSLDCALCSTRILLALHDPGERSAI
ncbi:MAG: hypothetical protein KDE55_17465 [Novosphingobium sp.]|nr:hypothetical protein [Novosphingobium sp.]